MLRAAEDAIDQFDFVLEKLRAAQRRVNAAERDERILPAVGRKAPQAERVQKVGERVDERAVVQRDVRLKLVELRAADGPLEFPGGLAGGDDAAGVADDFGILLGVRLAQLDERGLRLAKLQIIQRLVRVEHHPIVAAPLVRQCGQVGQQSGGLSR